MTRGIVDPPFGPDAARALLAAGWTQGSVFRPNALVTIPEDLDRPDAHLVVCTQACSLVSPSLDRDPFVELAVAVPITRYAPRSEAATGKDVRRHHLPVAGAAFPALEVDINARFRVPREYLLAFAPDGPRASAEACRDLAGWIGRYYTRIALPDALVVRLKGSVFEILGRFLKGGPAGGGPKHHEGVHSIYLRWQPDAELAASMPYAVDLLILCDEVAVADALGARLAETGLDPDHRVERDGLSVHCSVQARSETLLTDLDGWTRLSEWDHMTGLGETAAMPG